MAEILDEKHSRHNVIVAQATIIDKVGTIQIGQYHWALFQNQSPFIVLVNGVALNPNQNAALIEPNFYGGTKANKGGGSSEPPAPSSELSYDCACILYHPPVFNSVYGGTIDVQVQQFDLKIEPVVTVTNNGNDSLLEFTGGVDYRDIAFYDVKNNRIGYGNACTVPNSALGSNVEFHIIVTNIYGITWQIDYVNGQIKYIVKSLPNPRLAIHFSKTILNR